MVKASAIRLMRHGLDWGKDCKIRCMAEYGSGTKVLRVQHGSKMIDIYISPTGRSMRAFDSRGRELKVREG